MAPVTEALDKNSISGTVKTDVYNTLHEAVYSAIKDNNILHV